MKRWQRWLGGQADIAIVLALIGVLMVLFLPIPKPLLDFLILANFSFALLVLLLAFYVAKPVDLSTFPSLLLLATLFRLSLNVAATRLILADGDAGRVISAVGAYVVGGNFVVGLIVFCILVVVQFVVVTSGAQRVSEVAARFTLDSLPGQQMSIDADLNMGFIDQAEAQRRRRALEREAAFHGAMDGASKFVKGDAIAGVVILLVNVVGGLVIGIVQHRMKWDEALHVYTLLTIGDGIVTQVPALVIAVATGLLVTRSASDGNLSVRVLRQLTSAPKTLWIVAGALALLSALPGIPAGPAVALAVVAAAAGLFARRFPADTGSESESKASSAAPAGPVAAPNEVALVEPLEVLVGSHWSQAVTESEGAFQTRLAALRRQFAEELGLALPPVRLRTATRLAADAYEIHIDGGVAARGEARQDRLLAIHPGGETKAIAGEATRDPTYGLPALWIAAEQRDAAHAARFTTVDAVTVFLTQLTETVRREAASLLTRAEAERLIARVRATQPALVEEVIPVVLSMGDVQKVLQTLLKEKVPIRHLEAILETLADAGRGTKDVGQLAECVRQRLGHVICQSLSSPAGALHVLTLEPAVEGRLLQTLRASDAGGRLLLEPGALERLLHQLLQNAEKMMKNNLRPVLLCTPELRRPLRSLVERGVPHLRVLSMSEVSSSVELKAYAAVGA